MSDSWRPSMGQFEVLVGNIGIVHKGDSFEVAKQAFDEYAQQSKEGYGRAAGEEVTLFNAGEPIRSFDPSTRRTGLVQGKLDRISKKLLEDGPWGPGKGVGGWPLTLSKRWPGEQALTCPKCGSQNITSYGTSLRPEVTGYDNGNKCEDCGYATRWDSRYPVGESKRKIREYATFLNSLDVENTPVVVVFSLDEKAATFPNLAAARQQFPGLDPYHNSSGFTWAMRGQINGKDALHFEAWPVYNVMSV